ncbi:MAG: tetratricopeptide repeat protein [Sphingomonadaceae bacterium]
MALLPKTRKSDADRKAERQAAEDDALLREVDDAVRQDQYADFASKYGKLIVGLLVVGILCFGGYLWWHSRHEAALEADSEVIIGSIDNFQAGNVAAGDAHLGDVADKGKSEGGRTVAKMLEAGAAVKQNKPEEGAKLFGVIAADDKAPQEMRDLASIREVTLRFDSMKPEDVIARLKPMAVPGKPYFGSAGELVAMAYLEQGKTREAGTLFGEIARNEDVPQTIRSRARQIAGLLGVDAIQDVDKLLEEQGAASGPPVPGQ